MDSKHLAWAETCEKIKSAQFIGGYFCNILNKTKHLEKLFIEQYQPFMTSIDPHMTPWRLIDPRLKTYLVEDGKKSFIFSKINIFVK